MSELTLKERLEKAEQEAKSEAIKKCEERNRHRWDSIFGREVSGGGELIEGGFGGCGDYEPNPQYTERWRQSQRECIDCGEIETSQINGAEWRYDAKRGHFECDSRTGELFWVTDTTKKRFSDFMMFDD